MSEDRENSLPSGRGAVTLLLLLAFTLAFSLAAQLGAIARPYPVLKAKDFATFNRSHACILATAAEIGKEIDGDIHIRLEDETGFVIAEEIPTLKGVKGIRPKKGQKVMVCGIVRQDKHHKHFELHPVESYGEPP